MVALGHIQPTPAQSLSTNAQPGSRQGGYRWNYVQQPQPGPTAQAAQMQTGEKSPPVGVRPITAVVGEPAADVSAGEPVLDVSVGEPVLDASVDGPVLDASTAEAAIYPSAAERENFVHFLDGEYALVIRFVMRCGAGLQEAQDATQEAFLAAWIELGRGRWAEIANLRGWIRRVALYQCRRLQGRSKKGQALPVSDLADMPQPGPDHADLTEGIIFVNEALSVLDPELRAVMAFDMDGFTASESGRLLGLTDQQIRDRRKKARRILAKHLAGVNALKGESV